MGGRLEEFDGKIFVDDKLLEYIGLMRKCPLLEDLSLVGCGSVVFHMLYEITGETCPRLNCLQLSTCTQAHPRLACFGYGYGPLGIATLHQLRHLGCV
uniref:FBD domain-containing protein n=1 Tax=Oryza meridionalis TaxID=40149 RepID=A0A0E0EIW5_9ORYZ